jgi:hypothetical protein
MTHPPTHRIANAMLEGSFTALLWLSAFALITNDQNYRTLALAAIGAVSLAIAAILAIPGRWLRTPSQDEECHADNHNCASASASKPVKLKPKRTIPGSASIVAAAKPTPQQENPR